MSDKYPYMSSMIARQPIEHRAHYLQQRDYVSSSKGISRILYMATCDCGWVGEQMTDGPKAALQYAKHVGYVNTYPCGECGK